MISTLKDGKLTVVDEDGDKYEVKIEGYRSDMFLDIVTIAQSKDKEGESLSVDLLNENIKTALEDEGYELL